MIKDTAANYFSHFYFKSRDNKLELSLSEHAPRDLVALLHQVCGDDPSQDCITCLYDCLCSLAGEEAQVAPDACTEDIFREVSDYLTRQHA